MSTKSRGSTEPSIAIKAWALEYMAAVKAGDIDENLSLHTEDVIWMQPRVPDSTIIKGKFTRTRVNVKDALTKARRD